VHERSEPFLATDRPDRRPVHEDGRRNLLGILIIFLSGAAMIITAAYIVNERGLF
jgi:hypothetical protein